MAAVTLATAFSGYSASEYTPRINGTLRARLEATSADGGAYRFQVRNARFSLTGNIAPTISYFFNTDLCDRGKMKILDAWGRVGLGGGVAWQMGQFRMPFGVEPYRAPHTYIFANRSFIGKQVCNYRAVGMQLSFARGPVTVEAGAFNPGTIGDHETWNNRLTGAARILYKTGGFTFSGGGSSLMVGELRANMLGLSGRWAAGRWQAEAEYMHKHFNGHRYAATHAWCVWGDYVMPVNAGQFNQLSLQARADGMTAHAADPVRNRLTAGATLTYAGGPVHADVRLNAEKNFFRRSSAPVGEGDKLLIELVVRF